MTRRITVSGLPGSGTSTLSRLLAERTGLSYINAGQIFRDLAREAGVSLEELGRLAETDPDIDRRLDRRMIELAGAPPGCVLEGRVTGWMVHRRGLPALKVWVRADAGTRAARVAARDRQSLDAALAAVQAREDSERRRYAAHHGIDIGDLSIYDLVVDSSQADASGLATRVEAALEATPAGGECGR